MIYFLVIFPLFVILSGFLSAFMLHITKGFTRTYNLSFPDLFKMSLFFQTLVFLTFNFSTDWAASFGLFASIIMGLFYFLVVSMIITSIIINKNCEDINTFNTVLVSFITSIVSSLLVFQLGIVLMVLLHAH
jgi:hypothetical protein